jgi:hypothetical protein
MTAAQAKWLEVHRGWKIQEGGGEIYIQAGLVDPEGGFSLTSTSRSVDTGLLPKGSILVGIPL